MENVLFKQSFMGFDRTQVLKYIDELSSRMNENAENFQKAQSELESQIETLSKQLEDAQNSLDADSIAARRLEKDVKSLKSENAEFKRQIALYRNMISERDFEITKIKNEYNEISDRAHRLRAENEDWKSKQNEIAACMVEASVRAREIIADANRQAEATRKEFEKNASRLMSRVTDVKAEIASLEEQLEASFNKLTAAVRDMDKAGSIIEKQVRDYTEKVGEIATFIPAEAATKPKKSEKKTLTDTMLDTIAKLLEK
ncbi:MAG: hypothetical protein PUB11_00180 [Oscillospiraceae bacterium]|nr:hypothetical protein [Oscillospiraceae bacterium]